jgi:hypothetical protein
MTYSRQRTLVVGLAYALIAALLSLAGASAATTEGPRRATVVCPRLKALPARAPHRFFPQTSVGLTAQRTAAGASYGCVYVIPPRSLKKVPVWQSPTQERMRGPTWSPHGQSFAVAQRVDGVFYVFRVDLAGRITLKTLGKDFAFLRDGRMVVRRSHAIVIERPTGDFRPLTSERALERAAGFRADFYGVMSEVRGSSPEGVVIQWWARVGQVGNVLLLVDPKGHVQRLTPLWRSAGTYMPGPSSWSPDGQKLMIPWQRRPSSGTADHVHCLGVWSKRSGFRSAFCKNPHFGSIVWAPDGRRALLQNGRVVSENGKILGPPRRLGPAFGVRWTK